MMMIQTGHLPREHQALSSTFHCSRPTCTVMMMIQTGHLPREHQALPQLQQVCVQLQRILGMPRVEEEEEWGHSEPGELQQLKQRRPAQSSSSWRLVSSDLFIK